MLRLTPSNASLSGLMRDGSIFSSPLSTSRSSVLISASGRLKGTCCIGLKAAMVRITVPRSNWRSLKGSAFNGSPITRDGRLRTRKTRHSRVITGHGDIPMSVQAMKAGAVDFLTKPFREQEILDAVSAALERDGNRCNEERSQSDLQHRFA